MKRIVIDAGLRTPAARPDITVVSCLLALWLLAACAPPPPTPIQPTAAASVAPVGTTAPGGAATPALRAGASVANPASQNCVEQGGTLSIETRGDGGEYGVCLFEDDRQCEEWVLLHGDCTAGGIKVTGYVTPAARFCAISGGEYVVTSASGSDDEQGTCTFKDGEQCDAWDYYDGRCGSK